MLLQHLRKKGAWGVLALQSLSPIFLSPEYSIVKDSSANLGVNFKIVQNRPTVEAACT